MGLTLHLTDPYELLEIYDSSGQPTGIAKTRGAIHVDGDWHRAFFCWVARRGPRGVEILLQHRAETKDVFPGRFDGSAAGHVRFGESLAEAAREIREELGLDVGLGDMVAFGTHRQEHLHPNGLIDREHHVLHLLPRISDDGFRPDPSEVLGLAWMSATCLIDLVEQRVDRIGVRYRATNSGKAVWEDRTIVGADLVPYPARYHRRVFEAAARCL